MRLLQRSSVFLPLEKLGFPTEHARARFESLIKRPHGIVLVTGPTGSGKTTTLYAALDKINSPGREDHHRRGSRRVPAQGRQPDPGEGRRSGSPSRSGLRHIVRQDPDVILVGEIRDLETAEIAIQASLTGHLVFSTLHTNDAPGAITRLQDMGVEPYLVASVLEGVLAQRLVRRICAACRVPDTPSQADLDALGIAAAAERRALPRQGLRRLPRHRLPRPHRHLRAVRHRRGRAQPHAAPRLRPATSAGTRSSAAWSPCGWTAGKRACEGVTTVEEILRVTQEDA